MSHYKNIKVSVGIDIARKDHHGTILINERKILAQFFFSNSSKGFNKFLSLLTKHLPDGFELSEVTVAMEATGHYYLVFSRWLQYFGLKQIVCNLRQSKYLPNVVKPYFKTDPIDSHVLALGAELELLKGEIYNKEHSHLKEMLQIRRKLNNDITRLKNQVTRLVDLIFPERSLIFKDLFSKTSLAVLQLVPTPKDLLDLGQRELAIMMIKSSYNRIGLKHTKKLLDLASSTVGITDPIWVYELKLLLPTLVQIQGQILQVNRNISDYTKQEFGDQLDLLKTLPGVKDLTGAAIIGFLGDLRRFDGGRSGRKVVAFAGLAIKQHSSGTKQRHWGISKAGPPLLRFYLHFAALTGIRLDGPFKEFYHRLTGRGTPKLKAIVAVSGKMLRTAYSMLRDHTPFDPQMVYPRVIQIKPNNLALVVTST